MVELLVGTVDVAARLVGKIGAEAGRRVGRRALLLDGDARRALRRFGVLGLRQIDAQPVGRARVPFGHADRAGRCADDGDQRCGQQLGLQGGEHQAALPLGAGGAAARVWNVRPAM